MCFLEKVDYLIWIKLDGADRKGMLRLQRDHSGKGYNDFFTIERVADGGAGTELLYTLPFSDIESISYKTSASDGTDCAISFEMKGDDRFREIRVDRPCFNYLYFRKMIRIYEKGKRTAR